MNAGEGLTWYTDKSLVAVLLKPATKAGPRLASGNLGYRRVPTTLTDERLTVSKAVLQTKQFMLNT